MIKKQLLVNGIFFLVIIAVIILVVNVGSSIVVNKSTTVRIGDTEIKAEVADTYTKRTQGLSGREELAQDAGLLFVFEHSDFHGIWMRDMLFPIDIVWIGEERTVVDIKKNVSPDTYPQIFQPREKALYVLEVNAGFTSKEGIQVGDLTEIDL